MQWRVVIMKTAPSVLERRNKREEKMGALPLIELGAEDAATPTGAWPIPAAARPTPEDLVGPAKRLGRQFDLREHGLAEYTCTPAT